MDLKHNKPQNHSQGIHVHNADVHGLPSDKTILVSAEEFAKFSQYRKSLQEFSSVTTLAESGKACLISSSKKWVINSGATDHMTGNPNTFYSFQAHNSRSPVTVVDRSTCHIVGSGTVKPTSSFTLSSVLSLPKSVFNLISVSRLTKDLNCYISFFPDHCLFHDLMTKQVIGRGHVSIQP